MRDPAAAAPPLPWEDRRATVLSRFVATLASAARPNASAPAFARSGLGGARSFWALSFLPLALVSAIVPATHTLIFGPTFAVATVSGADPAAITLDVVRAIAIGLAVSLVALVALAVPFVTLTRAYAEKGYREAPVRAVLYRAYLLPLSQVSLHVAVWSAPEDPGSSAQIVAGLAQMLPLVLLFWSLRATARMASGVGPLASHLTAILPFVVMVLAQEILGRALAPILPDPEAIQRALEAARGGS